VGKSGNTFMGEYTHNMDDKNRLSIPAAFRERSPSGFVLTTVLIGVLDRIEIWNIKIWREYRKSVEHQLGDIAEKLSELGL